MDNFAKQALKEYNDQANMIRPGGVDGRNFWNLNSSQFMFVPSFQFPLLPATEEYEFIATDCNGNTHKFTAPTPTAPLTPIWKDIPVGMVELKVEGIHNINHNRYLCGVRTFYKTAPFPGREALPKKARSYKESALMAYEYTFNCESSQYWLNHRIPDPEYYHNVYPSKMISSLVKAMISYAKLSPEMAEKALKLATNAADYLISITYGADTAVEGLPPTYSFKGLNKAIVDENAPAADGRQNQIMMIYPANVGNMYLELEAATGDKKYFDAAEKIANYYKNNVLPCGSWYLLVEKDTNKPEGNNCCATLDVLHFLSAFYKRTNEECWHTLEKNFFGYLIKTRLETFNWEGQFEDIKLSGNYTNLTHFVARDFVKYIIENVADDQEMVETAKELVRYVEDQFVVWGDFAPWSNHKNDGDKWYSPAALEQYFWYVPIDSSTAALAEDFLYGYTLTHDELFLEKACALGDSITRMQNPDSGVFPTHWMKEDCAENLHNFWINCHIHTTNVLMKLAEAVGEV